jgi:hypothetical protein
LLLLFHWPHISNRHGAHCGRWNVFFIYIIKINNLLSESSLVSFWCLDDNSIKGLTSMLSVEQVLNVKLTGFNTSEQV